MHLFNIIPLKSYKIAIAKINIKQNNTIKVLHKNGIAEINVEIIS